MDAINLTTLIICTAPFLNKLTTVSDFKAFLDRQMVDVQELAGHTFLDTPSHSVENREIKTRIVGKSHLLKLKTRIREYNASPEYHRALHLETTYGPWIAYELLSQGYTNEVIGVYEGIRNKVEDLGNGYFKCRISGNIIRFSHYPDHNNFFVFIASHKEDIENLTYSWMKIEQYFS